MPSPTAFADQGLKAFNASNYSDAISLYSQALALNPEVPDYYLKRSTAYQRSGKYDLALHDAELAVMLANRRGKRELIGNAQLRRAIALQLLGRYGDAGFCFDQADKRCVDKEKNMVAMWKKKLELALAKVGEDDVSREVTVVEIPDVEVPKPQAKVQELGSEDQTESSKAASATSPPPQSTASASPPPPPPPPTTGVVTPANRIRHEWYQTNTHVVLTLYVKGVPKDKATVDINDRSLSISFPLPTGSDFTFDIEPLFDRVVPSESKYSILSTKVEVKMLKAEGKKWADLEGEDKDVIVETPGAKPESPESKLVYPSSSKTGPKDWNKLERELAKKGKEKTGKKKEGDAAGDDDMYYDSEEEGDPVNSFFKKLYKDADEDTRRAMMKSYVESNGTALSTNWSEVGPSKVEISPPEGMEAKKWEE